MVGQKHKSLSLKMLWQVNIARHFGTTSHSFPSFTVGYTFSAVNSVHNLATPGFESNKASVCKLLRLERKLVAGGGIEPPTLGL
jgi:hypothetical protein